MSDMNWSNAAAAAVDCPADALTGTPPAAAGACWKKSGEKKRGVM